jgi:hypothetical protein
MLLHFLYDFEDYSDQEEKIETFKQSLIQAFPTAYDKIYPSESSGGIPEGYEQKVPENDEEFEEMQKLFAALSGGQKTLTLDQLIGE